MTDTQAGAMVSRQRSDAETWARMGLNCALLCITGAVVGDTVSQVQSLQNRGEKKTRHLDAVQNRIIANGITTCSATCFPVLWDMLIGYEKLRTTPQVGFGYLYPMGMACIEQAYIMDRRKDGMGDAGAAGRNLGQDAQSVISAAFAIGALMSTLRSIQGVHLIMFALVACLAIVVPQVSTPPNSVDHHVTVAVQKSALNYALSFMFAGMGTDMLQGGASKDEYRRTSA